MIRLGKRICDCCEEEAEILYLHKHIDRYNCIHKQALCLECFKDETRVYSYDTCCDCGGRFEAVYEVDGKLYCDNCLDACITAYDGKEIDENG